jgi:type IV pilus assembly protein PilV
MMQAHLSTQRGVTLIEVLVTMVVLAFGLLGLAALQSKAQVGQVESYQRAQAAVLLQDMSSRIEGNSGQADSYITDPAKPLGTDSTEGSNCAAVAGQAARDRCEWSAALQGAGESNGSAKVGGMLGARGCIQRVQDANPATGICTPAIYLVTVVWQGLHATKDPAQTCGQSLYGTKAGYRRAVSARVSVGLTTCS